MTRKLPKSVVVSLLAFGALAVVFAGVLLHYSGGLPSFGANRYKVRAVVPSAMSLAPGAGVRIAGLRVGRVDEVDRVGVGTVVTMEIDDDQAPIPTDSTIALRLRSLIGESYVEVLPGRARTMLPSGGTVPADQTTQYVEVEQILDQFKGKTRRGARQLFRGLGEGLKDRGPALNDIVRGGSASLSAAAPVFRTLAQRRAQVARLIDQFGALNRTIGEKGTRIRTLAAQATTSFNAIARRDAAVRQIVAEAPATLRQVRSSSLVLGEVSRGATPVIARLARAIDTLEPAVAALRPAGREGQALLGEVSRAQPGLSRTLSAARRLASPSAKSLPAVKQALCQLNPMLRYLAPYGPEVAHFFQNTASGTNFYDATGHAARLSVLVGEESFGATSDPMSSALKAITTSGLVAPFHQIGYFPYPAPGEGGATEAGRGWTGPSDAKAAKYVRVEADC